LVPRIQQLLEKEEKGFAIKVEKQKIAQEEGVVKASVEERVGERMMSFKSHFYQTVEHEFRKPMSAVLNISEILLDGKVDEQQQGLYIQAVHNSAHCMVHALDGMTTLAEIEQGRFISGHAPFEIKKMLNNVLSSARNSVLEKNVNLRVKLAKDLPDYLVGDHLRLRHILLNLIDNALNHTDEGDVVLTITTSALQQSMVNLYFKIEDGREEINPKALSEIFDDKVEQQDLKLRAIQNIAQTMNGDCGAEATGSGAAFWVRIPCEKITRSAYNNSRMEINKPSVDKDFTGLKVLVVDDERIQLAQAEMLLGKLGVVVDTCLTGEEALLQAKKGRYDVILMDCQMPHMDGFEVTDKLRKQEVTSEVPVIAHTAYLSEDAQDRCLAVGMNDFMSCPSNKDDYKNMLRKWALKGDDASFKRDF